MKSNLLFFVFSLMVTYSFGQINYEKGYLIDNNNRKTECLIKNSDWKNNPDEFIYKLNDSGVPVKGTIESIKEFGIYGSAKFIRVNTNIDRSSSIIYNLTNDKEPQWSRETLFLKVIIEGKASLYYYEDATVKRFFYSVSDTSVNQLVYKEYLVDNTSTAENKKYLQQLWVDVRCPNTSMNYLENISYTLEDLKGYFIKYKKCTGDSVMETKNKSKRDFFHLKISPGFDISSFSITDNTWSDMLSFKFNKEFRLRFGLESEFILPYNKNKWGVIIEPTYQSFSGECYHKGFSSSIVYKSIEFPIGVRYYFFLDKNSKLFLNGVYVTGFSLNFNSNIIAPFNYFKIGPEDTFALGGGFDFKGLSLEIRYYADQKLIHDSAYWLSDYRKISFIIGYRIINKKL